MRHKNLIQLMQANAARPRNWSIKSAGDVLTLYIYDVIGGLWGGVQAEDIVKAIADSNAKRIDLRINSPGGDVFDARAIASALRTHSAEVVARIEGLAASAASTIAMAADRVEIARGGFLMIHNAWTIAMGNKGEFLDMAAILEKIDEAIANDYVERTGKTRDQVIAWMDAETWFNEEEAVEHGFADAVLERAAKAATWDLAAYAHAPKIAPEPEDPRDVLSRRLGLIEACSA